MSPASKTIKRWREDPRIFVREVFGATPDLWQDDVLAVLPVNRRLAMKACKGPGKTCLLAWIAWWFLVCFTHPKIAATSISADNLSDNLWSEMSTWQSKSQFLRAAFTWTKTRIFANDHPETWWMSARTWPKTADANQQGNTLAGLHAEHLLFILDEVGGIPDAVMAAAEAGLANDHSGLKAKIIMAGNPTHLEGPLWRATTSERDLWHLTEITGDPDDPKRTPRVSIQWAREQITKYGRDNPWVLINVFGKFPPSSINTLLGPDDVSEAMRRKLRPEAYDFMQKRLGVDVALYGDDRTTLCPRQGLMWFKYVIMRTQEPADIAARVMASKEKWNQELELIDATGGWGSGVISHLNMAGHSPIGIQFAGKAIDPRYFNKRSEMWFQMAEAVKTSARLPNCPMLSKELTAPTYTLKNGRFLLEPKEMIKARLGYSPDIADGYALTFAQPEMPSSLSHALGVADITKCLHDYDPMADKL